ncbi:hypothetical protein BJ165DRAFT_1134561 [Panaeolus papilionaceus]|nr:hypothetical protein BJ165DRAFT_1134561 [Panaeolus papilionaceus]
MLPGLKHLPQLRRFYLYWFLRVSRAEWQEVTQFMNNNAAWLIELRLRLILHHLWRWHDFGDPSGDFSRAAAVIVLNSYFGLTFPSLRRFSLCFRSALAGHVEPVCSFLQCHSDQLHSLTLLPPGNSPRQHFSLNVISMFNSTGGEPDLSCRSRYSKNLRSTALLSLSRHYLSLPIHSRSFNTFTLMVFYPDRFISCARINRTISVFMCAA